MLLSQFQGIQMQKGLPANEKDAQELLNKMLDYNPTTGVLRWKVERYRKHKGDVAGCIYKTQDKNYWRINVSINYRRYLAHRLIWLMVTGKWPVEELDHMDRDATNNRWDNLREANHQQNGKNRSLKVTNTTGINGVSFDKKKGNYRARIMVNHKDIYLGNFDTVAEAAAARKVASKRYFGAFSRD
jgi:hypothetical protein